MQVFWHNYFVFLTLNPIPRLLMIQFVHFLVNALNISVLQHYSVTGRFKKCVTHIKICETNYQNTVKPHTKDHHVTDKTRSSFWGWTQAKCHCIMISVPVQRQVWVWGHQSGPIPGTVEHAGTKYTIQQCENALYASGLRASAGYHFTLYMRSMQRRFCAFERLNWGPPVLLVLLISDDSWHLMVSFDTHFKYSRVVQAE